MKAAGGSHSDVLRLCILAVFPKKLGTESDAIRIFLDNVAMLLLPIFLHLLSGLILQEGALSISRLGLVRYFPIGSKFSNRPKSAFQIVLSKPTLSFARIDSLVPFFC